MRAEASETCGEGRADQRFDAMLADGQLGPDEIRALAEALVRRHAAAEHAPDLALGAAAYARTLACQVELLSRSPRHGATAVVTAIERARRFLDTGADRLLARAGAGRTLASAEPLRLADVRWRDGRAELLSPPPSPAPPLADDAALELAHLSVALRLRGRGDLAERLISHYAGECDDFDLYPVLDFYEDFCAVERFTAGAPSEPPVHDGAAASRRPLGEPLLLVTSGPVASGKSTLARALADHLGAARTISDRIRDHLVHGAPGRALHEAGWADGLSPGFGPRVYAELLRRGELVLATGRSVVLDASFPTRRERDAARALARRLGVPFRFVECRVEPEVQRARLEERDRAEEHDGAWLEIARRFEEGFVAPDELAPGEHLTAETSGSSGEALAAVLEALDHGPGSAPPESPVARSRARTHRRQTDDLPRPPGAVTFDCWRTLLIETDWSAAHARRVSALAEAAQRAGLEVMPDLARRAFDDAWMEHLVQWRCGVATGAPEIARQALLALGVEPDGPALETLIAHWQEASHSGRVRAVEGAGEALERLARAGVPRALVCDTGLTPGRVVRELLESQGLLDWLDVCAFSDEIGVPKPSAAIFRTALAAFDTVPGNAVHVGDLLRTDVAGARALGMATIRLRAIYDDKDPLPEADAVADSFEEVVALLGA